MTPDGQSVEEYRVAHLQDRLAESEVAELGLRIELHGRTVVVSGTVPTAESRDAVARIAGEELDGLSVQLDLVVSDVSAPDGAEELP